MSFLNKFFTYWYNAYLHRDDDMPQDTDEGQDDPTVNQDAGLQTIESTSAPTAANPDVFLPWENKIESANNRHNIRVVADQVGLTYTPTEYIDGKLYSQKDIFTACIYQESEFYPLAIGKPNYDGTQDFGLCQYNNNPKNGWIGHNLIFENTQEALNNPTKNALIMAHYYKQHGHLNAWSSYHTGAFKKWLGVK